MKNFLAWLTSTIGTYVMLSSLWTCLEEWELGTAHVSTIDTIICFVISVLISTKLTTGIGM